MNYKRHQSAIESGYLIIRHLIKRLAAREIWCHRQITRTPCTQMLKNEELLLKVSERRLLTKRFLYLALKNDGLEWLVIESKI